WLSQSRAHAGRDARRTPSSRRSWRPPTPRTRPSWTPRSTPCWTRSTGSSRSTRRSSSAPSSRRVAS
ncbi:MAG: Prokaryotic ubiquitin-like protein Pup, partial [uncultured Friedmanniella sp.]